MITRPLSVDESYPFKEWDVITHIGDQAIDNQGDIPVGDELRLSFRYLIPKLVKDGKVDLTVWRNGQSVKVQAPVKYSNDLLIPHLSGGYPPYFICGPLVFTDAWRKNSSPGCCPRVRPRRCWERARTRC